MVQGYSLTDGAARWLDGAVRTLQKRVEMLEAKNSFEHHDDTSVPSHKPDDNVETGDTNTELQVPKRRKVGEWKYDKVKVRRPRRHAVWTTQSCSVPALDIPVATTPMDEYVTFAPTTEFVTQPAAILAATAAPVTALSDLLEPPVPVEYANYDGTIEELTKVMEETRPAVKDEHTEYPEKPTPDPLEDYISWLDTGPAPDEKKYFISMTRKQEVRYAARTIQWGWKWMHKKIKKRAAYEELLQQKLRDYRQRLVGSLPVGISAVNTEYIKQIQSNLKDAEKEWRMSFNEEMRKLEIDSRHCSRRRELLTVMKEAIGKLDD